MNCLTLEQQFDLALDHNTSGTILEELAHAKKQGLEGSFDESYALRCYVASNPSAPISLLLELADDEEIDVRYAVASNPSIPLDLIEAFSKIDEMAEAVIGNPMCTQELLRSFAKTKDESLRELIAKNPNCPQEILRKWSKLKSEYIRGAVAINPSTPESLLWDFSTDKEVHVRTMLALNSSCPTDLLLELSADEDADVRQSVAESQNCPKTLLASLENDCDENVVRAVARNSTTPLEILERLSVHRNGEIRLAVASNPESPEALKQIARCVPACSYPVNHQLASLIEPVVELMNLVETATAQFPDHPFLQHPGLDDISYAAPAWNPKYFVLPTPYADRTRSMLEGPFFSNDNYPWPEGSDAEFASPIVQIDLSEISRLRDKDYGDGLLQVFIANTEFVIRVIPSFEVQLSKLTAIPSDLEDDYSGYFTEKYWLGDGAVVSQIIGYEEPTLSANVYSSDGAPDVQDPPVFHEIYSRMKSLCMNDAGIHMFGTFYPIQYKHSDVGGEVFMSLDSCNCFNWGDCGNAQIFVHNNKDGSIGFSGQWSR